MESNEAVKGRRIYRAHLMVCAGTSCVASGSLKVRDALREEIHKHHLAEEVFLATTGCNGFCAAGPLMISFPEGILYTRIQPDDVPEFVD